MAKERSPEMFDLISQAQEMYLDRSPAERDLIYFVAKLDSEARASLILAYDFLPKKSEYS